jgi:5,6-dimethylbenzimidazole synthase
MAWRRDVRHFADRAVSPALIDDLLDIAQLSASVGNSQPWRWVQIDSAAKRTLVRANFLQANAEARAAVPVERQDHYERLKLEGIDKAPYQFAVFCESATPQGSGLGRHSMPETLDYSVVAMIANFWLAARATGLGVGWISILDPVGLTRLLDTPPSWKLIAYLCVGWPEDDHPDPELQRLGWQSRTATGRQVTVI